MSTHESPEPNTHLNDLRYRIAQAIDNGTIKLCNPTMLQALEIDGCDLIDEYQAQGQPLIHIIDSSVEPNDY